MGNRMVDRGTVLVGSAAGDHVSITAAGRWDFEGWLNAEIEVHCDGWRGRFSASFTKGELRRFAQEIRDLGGNLSGTAKLEPLEPNLVLAFTGNGRGHIIVKGVAQNHFETLTRLTFQFEIDQTFLEIIAEGLLLIDPAI